MSYKFSSLQRILNLFSGEKDLSAGQISEELGKSKVIVHKYLKALVENGKLQKIGKNPFTRYRLGKYEVGDDKIGDNTKKPPQLNFSLDFKTRTVIEKVFLKFSPTGKKLQGIKGFQEWCQERKMNIEAKLQDYLQIAQYIEQEQDNCGLLNADTAFGKDFEKKYLDKVLYADQYNYMDFGRGKLAELTFYAKQSQDKTLIAQSIAEIFPKLECLIQKEKFDAIAITPWSIERKNQLLGALKKELSLINLPSIRVVKYSQSGIFIPQKSLKTRQERIQNAKNTIFIDDKTTKSYKKVLLLDDFVGSGATLNETAKKLKEEGVKEVYGFAFVGNTNLSYEVIREI